jgi:hypothetical protein
MKKEPARTPSMTSRRRQKIELTRARLRRAARVRARSERITALQRDRLFIELRAMNKSTTRITRDQERMLNLAERAIAQGWAKKAAPHQVGRELRGKATRDELPIKAVRTLQRAAAEKNEDPESIKPVTAVVRIFVGVTLPSKKLLAWRTFLIEARRQGLVRTTHVNEETITSLVESMINRKMSDVNRAALTKCLPK